MGLPQLVTHSDFSQNVKDVMCSSQATTILTNNGLLFVLGQLIDQSKQQSQKTAASLWDNRKATKRATTSSHNGKQKNQVQFSWQSFTKIIAVENSWGGCALTKKGDIVFFNKFFKAEKLNGKSNILDAFVAKDRMFALTDDGLLDWDLGFILKNGFFTSAKQSQLDRQLDVKAYPPKQHLFSSAVCSSSLVPSTDRTSTALSIKTTQNGEIFKEKSSLISLGIGGFSGTSGNTHSSSNQDSFSRFPASKGSSNNFLGASPSRNSNSHSYLFNKPTLRPSPSNSRLSNNLDGFKKISLRDNSQTQSNGLRDDRLSKPLRFNTEESSSTFFGRNEPSRIGGGSGSGFDQRGLSNTSSNRGLAFNARTNTLDAMSTLKQPNSMLSSNSRPFANETLPRSSAISTHHNSNTFESKWQSLKPQQPNNRGDSNSSSLAPNGKDLNYFLNLISSGKSNSTATLQPSQNNFQQDTNSRFRDNSSSSTSFIQPLGGASFIRGSRQNEPISFGSSGAHSKSPFKSSFPTDSTSLLNKQSSGSFMTNYKSLMRENDKLSLDHSSISNVNNSRSYQMSNTLFGSKKPRNLYDALNSSTSSSQPKFHFLDAAGCKISVPHGATHHASSSITPRHSSFRSSSQVNILSESMQMNNFRNKSPTGATMAGGFEKTWSALNKSIEAQNRNASRNSRSSSQFQLQSPIRSRSQNNILPSPSHNNSFTSDRGRHSSHQITPRSRSFIEGIVDPSQRDANYFDQLKKVDQNKLYQSTGSSPTKRSFHSFHNSPHRQSSPQFRDGILNRSFDPNMSINSQNLFKSRRGSFGPESDETQSRLQTNARSLSPFNQDVVATKQSATAAAATTGDDLSNNTKKTTTISVGHQTRNEEDDSDRNKATAEANQRIGELQSQLDETITENKKLKDIISQSEKLVALKSSGRRHRNSSKAQQGNVLPGSSSAGAEDSNPNHQSGGDISDGSLIDLSCSDIFDDDDNPIYSDLIDPATLSQEDQIKRRKREERRANKLLASSSQGNSNADNEDEQGSGQGQLRRSKQAKDQANDSQAVPNKIDNLTSISEQLKNYPIDPTSKASNYLNPAGSPSLSGKYYARDTSPTNGGVMVKGQKSSKDIDGPFEDVEDLIFEFASAPINSEKYLEKMQQQEGINDDLNAQLEQELQMELQKVHGTFDGSNMPSNMYNQQFGGSNNASRSVSPSNQLSLSQTLLSQGRDGSQSQFEKDLQQMNNQGKSLGGSQSSLHQQSSAQGSRNASPNQLRASQFSSSGQRTPGGNYEGQQEWEIQQGGQHGSNRNLAQGNNQSRGYSNEKNNRNGSQDRFSSSNDLQGSQQLDGQNGRNSLQRAGSTDNYYYPGQFNQQQGKQSGQYSRNASPNQQQTSLSQSLNQKNRLGGSQERLSNSIGLPPQAFSSSGRSQSLRQSLPLPNTNQRQKQLNSSNNNNNNSLNMSRTSQTSNGRSPSNTPKRNSSLRYSDICNGFNNQMKKSHFIEKDKAFERATGKKLSQYSDPNSSQRQIKDASIISNRSRSGSKSPYVAASPTNQRSSNDKNNDSVLPVDLSQSQFGKFADASSPIQKRSHFSSISPIQKQDHFEQSPIPRQSAQQFMQRDDMQFDSMRPDATSPFQTSAEPSPIRAQNSRSSSASKQRGNSQNEIRTSQISPSKQHGNQPQDYREGSYNNQNIPMNNIQKQSDKILTIDDLSTPETSNNHMNEVDQLVREKKKEIAAASSAINNMYDQSNTGRFPELVLQNPSMPVSMSNLSPIHRVNNSQNLGYSGINIYSQLTSLQPNDLATSNTSSSAFLPQLHQVNDKEYKDIRESALQQVSNRKSERDIQAASLIKDAVYPIQQAQPVQVPQETRQPSIRASAGPSPMNENIYTTYAQDNPKSTSQIGKNISMNNFLAQTALNEGVKEQIHSDQLNVDRKQLKELSVMKDTLLDQEPVSNKNGITQPKGWERKQSQIELLLQQQRNQSGVSLAQSQSKSPLPETQATFFSKTVPSAETDEENQSGVQLPSSEQDVIERTKRQSYKMKDSLLSQTPQTPQTSGSESSQKLSFLDFKVKEEQRKQQKPSLLQSKKSLGPTPTEPNAQSQNNFKKIPANVTSIQSSEMKPKQQQSVQKEEEENIYSLSQSSISSLIAKQKASQPQQQPQHQLQQQQAANPILATKQTPQAQQAAWNLFNKEHDVNLPQYEKQTNSELQAFKKASQNSKICIVLALKAEKFELNRKSHAFQQLNLFAQMSKKNAQLSQSLSSSKRNGLSTSTDLQQVAKAAVIVVIKTVSRLLLRTKQQAFDEIKFSQYSLRPTIEQNHLPQAFQPNQNVEVQHPETPKRKSRRDFSQKPAQQRPTSDSPQRLASIQQKARASQQLKPSQLPQEGRFENQPYLKHNEQEIPQRLSVQQQQYLQPQQLVRQKLQSQNQTQSRKANKQGESEENEPSFGCLENSNHSAQFMKRASPPLGRLSSYPVAGAQDNFNYSHKHEVEEDHSYRPRHSPTYADAKEFEPDTFAPRHHRNLSQDEIQLFEELQQHHLMQSRTSAQGGPNKPKSNDFSYNDLYTQLPPRETHNAQFERYLSQFDENLSQQAIPKGDRFSFPQNENYMYEIEDDQYIHRDQTNNFTMQQTSEYIMKMLNQSQHYALLPENLQPGHVHKEKYRDLKISPITDYADVRKSALSDKKLNEQSLRNPPAQFLPGYQEVIHSQKQFIGKKFKTLHNQQVTGKELSQSPNNTFRMNNSTFQSPSRHLQSSQSLQQINLNSSRMFKSPEEYRFQSRNESKHRLDASISSQNPGNVSNLQRRGNHEVSMRAKTPKN